MSAPMGTSRIVDEMRLQWLKARVAGEALEKIARRYGVHVKTVGKATNDILKADRAEITRDTDALREGQLEAELADHETAYWAVNGRG